MTRNQKNKIVVEFMGGILCNSTSDGEDVYINIPDWFSKRDGTSTWSISMLMYDKQWNWLMPVIDKLKSVTEEPEELEYLNDDQLVITYEGNYHETIEKESIYFYHDTNHYVIGLIKNED